MNIVHIKNFFDTLVYGLTEKPRGLDFSRNRYPYASDSDNVWYERTNPRHIDQIFAYIKDKSLPLLDIGCGKGYLLYRLQKLGFTTTDGIEYDPGIAQTALRNMQRLKLDGRVHIHNVDARYFVGYDPYQIIYMFHPFRERVMRNVVRNVEASLGRCPRQFIVVYFYPVEHALWDNSLYFRRTHSIQVAYANTDLDVYYYEHDPALGLRPAPPIFRDVLHHKLQSSGSGNLVPRRFPKAEPLVGLGFAHTL